MKKYEKNKKNCIHVILSRSDVTMPAISNQAMFATDWSSASDTCLLRFQQCLHSLLQNTSIPVELFTKSEVDSDVTKVHSLIDSYYD